MFCSCQSKASYQTSSPSYFLESLSNDLNNIKLGDYCEIKKLLNKNVDTKKIARFALGKYNNIYNQNETKEFYSLYEEYLMNQYSQALSAITESKISIIGEEQISSNLYSLKTKISTNLTSEQNISYVIVNNQGSYNILDIELDGIKLSLNLRSEVYSQIESMGLEKYIELLKQHSRKYKCT